VKAKRGDVELPFVVDGSGDGPCLIFAHGLMGTGTVQRAQLGPLVDAGWTVVTFDQRGHAGATPIVDPAGYDPDEMGADLWAVADAAGINRCWIGGGSMGAATSFCASRAQADRVDGLIHGLPAFRETPHPAVFLFDALADVVRDTGTGGLQQHLRTLLKTQNVPIDDMFLEQLATHDDASLEVALRSVPRWVFDDVPSAFGGFAFPVVVLGWDDDPIHPLQIARDVAVAAGVDVTEMEMDALDDPSRLGRVLLESMAEVNA
jgi:pimeloyl-ACP methyl ester carboxylesterase